MTEKGNDDGTKDRDDDNGGEKRSCGIETARGIL